MTDISFKGFVACNRSGKLQEFGIEPGTPIEEVAEAMAAIGVDEEVIAKLVAGTTDALSKSLAPTLAAALDRPAPDRADVIKAANFSAAETSALNKMKGNRNALQIIALAKERHSHRHPTGRFRALPGPWRMCKPRNQRVMGGTFFN